jgi:hypothetical protein
VLISALAHSAGSFVKIRITSLNETELSAVRAFNSRIKTVAPFLLPERANQSDRAQAAISWTHYVALEGADVRGGFLLMEQPAFLDGQIRRVTNSQSMLSEGIRERKYGIVSIQMLKHLEHNHEYLFMVGMGSMEESLPRLLRGAGWKVQPVPFLFRIQNVGAFFREMSLFRNPGYRRLSARIANASGIAWLGSKLLQSHPSAREGELDGLTISPITEWGPWADEIWIRYKNHCCFSVLRDRSTLDLLYPLKGGRILAAVICRGAVPVGWVAWLSTRMHNHKHFGNLHVATILDCLAAPDDAKAVIHLLAHSLQRDADVLISNQAHDLWIRAFRRAGFLTAPSNYLLATSKNLTAAILRGGSERVHLTRGDSDGRIHL